VQDGAFPDRLEGGGAQADHGRCRRALFVALGGEFTLPGEVQEDDEAVVEQPEVVPGSARSDALRRGSQRTCSPTATLLGVRWCSKRR